MQTKVCRRKHVSFLALKVLSLLIWLKIIAKPLLAQHDNVQKRGCKVYVHPELGSNPHGRSSVSDPRISKCV